MKGSSDSTGEAAWAATIVAAIMIGQQVAGRALRDGFFLSHYPASALPSAMIGASLLSVAFVLGSGRLLRRVAPYHSLPFFFAGSAGLFVAEWALSFSLPRAAAAALYLHMTSIGAIVVSGFWSVVNERFDPHTAKALMGRIGGGASLGGVLGGLAAWSGASAVGIPTMILILGGLNGICVIGIRQIGPPDRRESHEGESAVSVLEILQETPYLRHLALLVGLAAFSGAAYDYVFKARVAEHFSSGAELVSFFALFYLGIGVATLVVQNLLVKRSLLTFGLAVTVGTLPGTAVALGLLGLFVPGIAAAAVMRGGIGLVENSFYRSAYELLYTPLVPSKKRPTKTLVDVGGDKLGAAIGGGVAFFLLGIFPEGANAILLVVGVAAGVWALFVARRLHRGYLTSLTESLRKGSIDASQLETLDATTHQAVSHTMMEMQRSAVLESAGVVASASGLESSGRAELLDRLRREAASKREGERATAGPLTTSPHGVVDASELDATVAAIVGLRSGDRARIEAVLAAHNPLPAALVSHAIFALNDEAAGRAAEEALQKVAPAYTGTLLDAVLHSRTPLRARRRVCDILGRLPTQRSADGLVLLLGDDEFELRFRAAAALLRIVSIDSKLSVPRDRLFEAAQTEARDCARRWRYLVATDEKLSGLPALESSEGRRIIQSLTYIFSVLLAVLDREPLRLAIRAIATGEGGHRGTGLEYLDNVLPTALRDALWPLLVDHRLALGSVRSRSDVLGELVADSSGPSSVDFASLRRRVDAARKARRAKQQDRSPDAGDA